MFTGSLLGDLNNVRGLGGLSGESYVDKDLRTLLGERVRGRFNLSYCGNGSLDACRASLWAAVHSAADDAGRAVRRRRPDQVAEDRPRPPASCPGLLPNRFPTTNRPTFQQVLEFQHRSR